MIAEKITSLKRDPQGALPLEVEIQKALTHPTVSFHLLPLPTKAASTAPKPEKPAPKKDRSRTPPKGSPTKPAGNLEKDRAKERGAKDPTKRGGGRMFQKG